MTDTLIRVLPDGSRSRGKSKRPSGLTEDELRALYEEMQRIRIFDQRMLALQRQGRIGFFGMVLGQEASIVGSAFATDERDWIVPALREGGIAMIRGLPLDLAVAQLIGNGQDLCRGRQMPCHYTWKKGRYVAMSSVIGTQISHAAGMAMAAKYRRTDEVVLGYMGDGATSSNDFHAGLNFASVYKAPCVFICQNNQWSISVPFEKQTRSETIAAKAAAYGMPGVRVDGNDVLAVRQVVSEAIERARAGEGPTLVECLTYRRLGHSSSDDPTRYRDDAEVREWEAKDPVDRYRRWLEQEGLWDDGRDEEFRDRVSGEISKAIRQAEEAPPLPPESVYDDVFAEPDPRLVDHVREALGG